MLEKTGWDYSYFINDLDKIVQDRSLLFEELKTQIIFMIMSPLILFVLGSALLWAIAGFRFK
jgi:hypothetical protein